MACRHGSLHNVADEQVHDYMLDGGVSGSKPCQATDLSFVGLCHLPDQLVVEAQPANAPPFVPPGHRPERRAALAGEPGQQPRQHGAVHDHAERCQCGQADKYPP